MTARGTGRRILVTDGEQRAALALVRAYGAAGHEVHVASTRGRTLAGASRWARTETAVPDALAQPDLFVEEVLGLVRRLDADVLVPVAEPALLALLPARARFAGVCIPFAADATFRAISDKARLLAAAPTAGIAVPRQWVLEKPEHDVTLGELPFPLVVKGARSVSDGAGKRTKTSVAHVKDARELTSALARIGEDEYPLLVQQRIVGPGVGIFLLRWDGETRAVFAHRRIREKPPAGGVSVYRESIAADPELVARSQRLLDRFAWDGVAMVEYKLDARTGTPYLMEVNGRFWGSLQLALDAGVDFPNLLLDAALGRPAAPPPTYRTGVRLRWELGELDHLLAIMRHSPESLALPADAPGRWRTLAEVLLPRRGDRREVLRLSDPKPFLREGLDWIARR